MMEFVHAAHKNHFLSGVKKEIEASGSRGQ
jgi:hypothetical protein